MLSKKTPLFLFYGAVLVSILGLLKLYHDFHVPFTRTGLKNILGFYAFLIVLMIALLRLILSHLVKKTATRFLIWTLFCALMVSLVIAETGLRLFAKNATYTESQSGFYLSKIHNEEDTLNIIYPSYRPVLETSEFSYPRIANSDGFRDLPFVPNMDSSKTLIQTYGDSFTEGDGTCMDSSYPSALRHILAADGRNNILIQNMGICGNDPGFYEIQLRNRGLKQHPQLLVMTYSSFDFTFDFFCRGGLSRFGTYPMIGLQYPRWEILYAYSYIFRLIVKAVSDRDPSTYFMNAASVLKRQNELKSEWNKVFVRLNDMAKRQKIKIFLIKKPEGSEVINRQYMYDFSFFEKELDTLSQIRRYDLLPYYLETEQWNEKNTGSYYWKKDGHHNSKGYAVMAKGVFKGLKEAYPEIFH